MWWAEFWWPEPCSARTSGSDTHTLVTPSRGVGPIQASFRERNAIVNTRARGDLRGHAIVNARARGDLHGHAIVNTLARGDLRGHAIVID